MPHIHGVERAHHLAEVPDTGQNDLGRAFQAASVSNHLELGSNRGEGIRHRPQVPSTIIEDADHRRPLVDGSWRRRRRSLEHAYFSPRAKHLKMASILWWLERPSTTFT